ncbi:MAG: hypothetical protein AAF533_09645 [Acidobacteriota bacterium]
MSWSRVFSGRGPVVVGLVIVGLAIAPTTAASAERGPQGSVTTDLAEASLSESARQDLERLLTDWALSIKRRDGGRLVARRPGDFTEAEFRQRGLLIRRKPRRRAPTWQLVQRIVAFGRAETTRELTAGEPRALGDRVEHEHGPIVARYVNRREQLEQQLIVRESPPDEWVGPLVVDLSLEGELIISLVEDRHGEALELRRSGKPADLRHGGLTAEDAKGRALRASMTLVEDPERRLRLVVDDRGAAFPITIGSTWTEVLPVRGERDRGFGPTSVSGDTVLVGDSGATIAGDDVAAAYLLGREGGRWRLLRKLSDGEGEAGCESGCTFGFNVALDGDLAVVGDPRQELAHVYSRDHGGPDRWGAIARLAPSARTHGHFGIVVAVRGGDVAVANWDGSRGSVLTVFSRHVGGPEQWGAVREQRVSGHRVRQLRAGDWSWIDRQTTGWGRGRASSGPGRRGHAGRSTER